MDYKVLKIAITDGIATVTLNRPEAMNALNSAFFSEMAHFVSSLKGKPDVKVMIITGEGKAFAAGADIAEMAEMNSELGHNFSKTGQAVFNSLEALEIPVIAAVNGFSLGGGCELAMACDFRIASNKAKFGQPEVNLGLIPGYAATQRLSRLTSLGDSLYLLMTADMITADEALRIGLVQKVVEPELLMPTVLEIAKKIMSKGQKAIKNVKICTRKGFNSDFNTGSDLEAEVFGASFGNGESGEGMKAFLEKRAPDWK